MDDIPKKGYKAGSVFLLCLIILALIKGLSMSSVETAVSGTEFIFLKDKWEKNFEQTGEEQYTSYICTIPQKSDKEWILSIKSYWVTIQIFLDDQEIYFYEDSYQEKGTVQHWIKLPRDAAGKKLILRSPSNERLLEQTMKASMYLGEKEAVILQLLKENLYAIILGGIALLMSGGVCFIRISIRKGLLYSNYKGIEYLGAFIFLVGIWIITDSQILQGLTGKTAFIALLSFFSFMIMPVFFFLFIREMMVDKKQVWNILCVLYLINMGCCAILYLFRILPLYKAIFAEHMLILVSIFVILENGIKEIRKYKNEEMKKIVLGFMFLSIFSLIALLIFYTNPSGAYSYFYGIGVVIFILCLSNAAMKRLYYQLEQSASITVYRKLAYIDSMTSVGNRTAFMREQEKDEKSPRLAYIMMDINNLKSINDQYGHREGDELIIETAKCIQTVFEKTGKCFRIGGDEFVVVLKNIGEEEIVHQLDQLDERVEQINRNRKNVIEIAYGYAIQGEDFMTTEELLRKADVNMYIKKQEMKKSNKE